RRFAFSGKLYREWTSRTWGTRTMPERQPSPVFQYLRKVGREEAALRLTDRELLDRFLTRRDEAAFALLVRRHGPRVLGLCRWILRNDQDAEDAFQATFLVLGRKAASLQPRASLAGWLHRVAYRIAQQARIAAARRRKHEGHVAGRPVVDPLAQIT